MISPIEMNHSLQKLMGDKIARFCRPLVDMLEINQFYHYTMNHRGEYAAVGLHAELQEYLISHAEWSQFIPYVYHNMDNLNGLVFTQALSDSHWKKTQGCAAKEFNVHLGLQINRKTAFGIEGFGFGLKTADPLHHMALLNHANSLQIFIDQYKREIDTSLLQKHLVDGSSLVRKGIYDSSDTSAAHFKKVVLGGRTVKTEGPLSARESEIAVLLLDGYSAAQIGDILFRSNRTIESHIERMKDKLVCSRRSELIQKLKELKSIGL